MDNSKTAGKTKRVYVRVTDDEHTMIKNKSSNYPSISSLMIDAVKAFDVKQGRNRLDILIDFSSYAQSIETEMARVGNNLNQITHEIHLYKYGGCDLPSISELEEVLKENLELSNRILREIRRIGNKNSQV